MITYKYIRLQKSRNTVIVLGTDPEVLDMLVRMFEEQRETIAPHTKFNVAQSPRLWFMRSFIHERGDERYVYWWLLQTLCEGGWEPFAYVEETTQIAWHEQIHLRKAVTE